MDRRPRAFSMETNKEQSIRAGLAKTTFGINIAALNQERF